MSSPARFRQDIKGCLRKRNKNDARRCQGHARGLAAVVGVYGLPNRSEMHLGNTPMLRGLTQLQKVAENDHFACSDQSSLIRSRIDVLVLKTCQSS